MAITDDVRKALTDPTPLYAIAGTVDFAAEKAKEIPALVEKFRAEAPKRFEAVRNTDPKTVQDRVSKEAKEAQDWITRQLSLLDSDFKKLSQQTQDLVLQGVGRAAEAAVKAREGYEELAERGRNAVQTWRSETAEATEDLAVAIEPEPKQEPVTEPGSEGAAGADTVIGADAKAASAKKTTTAKKTTAKKTTPPAENGK
ncbi:hypothetical protein CP973_37145 [Streptomyces albofaciens JCM 4342]|uniref:hypothetical protein n=1 Tax=Streptomyces albofaciens TaxID=66866 RepID=UPI00123C0D74|nr:hypothetical protein [Streptomyces albofaciens]KAA6214687.1 hypothetical protein CP973_37145 [Streptomyces albofaciens JCM 4342]